ncbi:MAG: hypothetical protein RXR09_06535 [Acidilobus sp.]|jgi:ABC-type dipeptide/oligopeptide/nickel transport system ATPase component
MVFISHDMAMLFEVVNYRTVMYAGEVVEIGDYRTLLEDQHHPIHLPAAQQHTINSEEGAEAG